MNGMNSMMYLYEASKEEDRKVAEKADEKGIVENFMGSPFSSPEEDEAFAAIEKKQNCSVCGGHNKQIENERLRAQIQSLRDYCDRLLAGEMG